jgi:hypothetical protein
VPGVGEDVVLHVSDGSWLSGFRCISGSEEEHVWVATETQFARAVREGREPAGDRWPLDQLAGVS